MELMRQVEVVVESLSVAPVPELRSGGLGVREARRLAKATGIDEQRLGLVLELAAGRRTDRQVGAGSTTSGRRGDLLGTDGGRRPVRRIPPLASRWLVLPGRGWICPSRPGGSSAVAVRMETFMRHCRIRCTPPLRPLDRQLLLGMLRGVAAGIVGGRARASRALICTAPVAARLPTRAPSRTCSDEAHAVRIDRARRPGRPGRALPPTATTPSRPR